MSLETLLHYLDKHNVRYVVIDHAAFRQSLRCPRVCGQGVGTGRENRLQCLFAYEADPEAVRRRQTTRGADGNGIFTAEKSGRLSSESACGQCSVEC